MDDVRKLSAIRGCLLGGAIGDALGYAVEFWDWKRIQRRYGEGGIQAYEPDFQSGLALISDDTQMSLFTANGLLSHDARKAAGLPVVSPEMSIFSAYLDWYHCQCSPTMPKDNHSWLSELPEMHERRAPGNTCMSALRAGEPGSTAEPANNSKGCGGIMRVAPVALWGRGVVPIEQTDRLAAEAAALTHGHPLGWMSAAALADIVARAAFGEGDRDLYAITEACKSAMSEIYRGNAFLDKLIRIIDQAVEMSRNDAADVDNIHRIGGGWTGDDALGISLYCALKYQDDFSKAVIASVNHSGDSDSTGAITGNIVGARLGEAGIEEKWLDGLELKSEILELAEALSNGPADARKYLL